MESNVSASPSTGEAGRAYSGTVAIALALGVAFFARILFGFAEAGPAANVVAPAYPFIILTAVFFTGRYAFRAFRHIRKARRTRTKRAAGVCCSRC
jgi:hypothetical protein